MTIIQPVKTLVDLANEAKVSKHMTLSKDHKVLLLSVMKKLQSEVAAHVALLSRSLANEPPIS
ncbi:hypothetical protein PsorP6_001160 [Peronosclerospora sorghi]|uniref:Uncharacterized protein n=1 Tax=Peronosclerospora sorghi TaxID=230839 RepID=A0ACC0WS25_9STRA|nr:hypothetical protein PsorP6_001160 [Peronosclerospora sorghi]